MANQRLTAGVLSRYIRGNTTEKAIVQVTGIKSIDSNTDNTSSAPKRYRLMLSDGLNTYSSCVLGIQMNKLIERNWLKENSIVRIDRALANPIDKQTGRIMLIIYELEVLQSNCRPLGNPIPLPLTDIINSIDNINRLEISNNNNDNEQVITTEVLQPNVNEQQTSKRTDGIDKERIINIDTLNPFMNKWMIKARVNNKTPIRHYENARGPGKMFSCDLVDQSGTIRATTFNAECEKLHLMLDIGQVYFISKASLKPANRQYTTTNHNYELTLNHDTTIEKCDDEESSAIPLVHFNFISINEITNRPIDTFCDVIGVVTSTSPVQTIVGKATQKQFNKRTIILTDEKRSISISLWEQRAEEFDGSSNPVVAFKGIKIEDFAGRSLSLINNTSMFINPTETPRTIELRHWFDTEGKYLDLPDISKAIDLGTRQTPIKTLTQIISEGLGLTDKPDYVTVKAITTSIKKDSAVYMMCPEENCRRKIIDENNGLYRCERCNKTFENFKWTYMVSAEISDSTGSQWINFFRNEGEMLLGISAEQYGRHKMTQNENILDNILRKAMNYERLFKLRIKTDQYQDEQKLRYTCINITDIDWPSYAKQLLNDIHHMQHVHN